MQINPLILSIIFIKIIHFNVSEHNYAFMEIIVKTIKLFIYWCIYIISLINKTNPWDVHIFIVLFVVSIFRLKNKTIIKIGKDI